MLKFLSVVYCSVLATLLPYTATASNHFSTSSSSVSATQTKDADMASANANVAQTAQSKAADKQKQISAEAINAVKETYNAIKALEENKKENALAALERATGKLELILARDPKIAFAPINVNVTTINLIADPGKVVRLRKEASELLTDGQIQAARHLLENLASETVISVHNIPLATYPAAIKKTAQLIDEDKQEEAKKLLWLTLNTLVVTKTVIPLPVLMAEELLNKAEALTEKNHRNEEENKHLSTLLAQAREELKLAQVLGYGTQQDFKNLYAQLDTIESKTADGKSGTGFFAKIKQYLTNTVASSQLKQPKTQPS